MTLSIFTDERCPRCEVRDVVGLESGVGFNRRCETCGHVWIDRPTGSGVRTYSSVRIFVGGVELKELATLEIESDD